MANRNYPKTLTATTAIPFDNPISAIPPKTITGATTFSKVTTGAQAGYGAILRVIADGTNAPDLSAFKSIGSGTYDNTNGVVNQLWFVYDGTDYCVSITQPVTIGGGGGDTTAPTMVSATAIDANTIEVVFSESVTPTVTGWSYYITDTLTTSSFSSVTGSGTTWQFTGLDAMSAGQTIQISYNSSTGNTLDGSSNELASFSLASVTNSIAGGSYTWVELLFPTLNQNTTITNAADNTFVPTSSSEWNQKGCEDLKLASGTDGAIIQQYKTDAKFFVVGVSNAHAIPNSATTDYADCLIGAYLSASGAMYKIESGTETSLGASLTVDDWVGIFRESGVWKIKKSSDKTTWTDMATLSGTPAGDLYPIYYVYKLDTAAKGYNAEGDGLV